MPAAAPARAHRDALDVAGAQRAPAVQQPALDHGRVPDELAVLPDERVDSAERVLPVVLGHVVAEHRVEEGPGRPQRRRVEVGGVRRAKLVHRSDEFPAGRRSSA